jgi:hypothetical protein
VGVSSKSADTLLGQCILRAGRVFVDENLAAGRDPTVPANRREILRATWASTRVGSNVATLIIEWALALDELHVDELGSEQFVDFSGSSRRTVYRRLSEFRRCWPEHDTPNELAGFVLAEARRRHVRVSPQLELALPA